MNGCEARDSFANGGFHTNNGDCGHTPPGRKRCWHHSRGRGSPPDHSGGACHVKLYVSPVPRTVTEAEIRSLFDGHGTIVEVVLLKDRKLGGQQGSCFVKYTNLDGADRAIKALCNHYIFPGEACPIIVKYADGERERLGVTDKVFVNGFHREASKEQIEEIFSPYGRVEEVFICRNEQKQSRGYGFVQFSRRDMALAAIEGLHEKFIMPGCSQPLIVRFADPKKPKTGDIRGNHASFNGYSGPCSWEPLPRQAPIYSDSTGGIMAPNHCTVLQSQATIHLGNSQSSTVMMQQTFRPNHSLPQWPPVPLQPMQMQHLGSQPTTDEMQRQPNQVDSNAQNIDQLQLSQMASSQSVSTTGAVQDVTVISPAGASPECDWSEHTCPDGYKYYYNCVTCESRWEKPEEYAIYEQKIRKLPLPNIDHHLRSPLPLVSHQQCAQTQKEAECVQLQPETSSVIGPTCC